jgi:hypothetical protein
VLDGTGGGVGDSDAGGCDGGGSDDRDDVGGCGWLAGGLGGAGWRFFLGGILRQSTSIQGKTKNRTQE